MLQCHLSLPTLTKLRAGRYGVRFPAGAGNFSLHHVQTRYRCSFPGGGGKRPGREADHSPPSSAEVKNAWSYTSTPPIRLNGVVLTLTQEVTILPLPRLDAVCPKQNGNYSKRFNLMTMKHITRFLNMHHHTKCKNPTCHHRSSHSHNVNVIDGRVILQRYFT
jgi:hypothetical protein